MLLLLFEIEGGRFALDAGIVVRVIPRINCKKNPTFPEYVAGIINYHGKPIPVIDLNSFHNSAPCKALLSTRIIIVNHIQKNFSNVHVGLIAERVTETVTIDTSNLYEKSLTIDLDLGVGKQAKGNAAAVQWYDLDHLLSDSLLDEIIQE